MYTVSVPFKDFKGKARNQTIYFNLTEVETFKLIGPFQRIFSWRESIKGDLTEVPTEEVKDFYDNIEEIVLTAYGVPSEDGLHFRKSGRYDFEESAVFHAFMLGLATDPLSAGKFIEEVMPKGLEDVVKNADASLIEAEKNASDEAMRAEIARLRAQLETASPAATA